MREQFRVPRHKQTPAGSSARQLAWQGELLRTQSAKFTSALLEEFSHNQTWQVPTLVMLRNVAFPTASGNLGADPRTQFIPRRILEGWKKDRSELLSARPAEFRMRQALLDRSFEIVGKMNAAGVRIMAGTDTAAPFVFPGTSLHDELALLVEAGLTPLEALEAATRRPAEFLGRLEEQGTVEPGKIADLLLLDANPLDNIGNIRQIRAVILRGKLFDRPALDAMLARVRAFAAAR